MGRGRESSTCDVIGGKINEFVMMTEGRAYMRRPRTSKRNLNEAFFILRHAFRVQTSHSQCYLSFVKNQMRKKKIPIGVLERGEDGAIIILFADRAAYDIYHCCGIKYTGV